MGCAQGGERSPFFFPGLLCLCCSRQLWKSSGGSVPLEKILSLCFIHIPAALNSRSVVRVRYLHPKQSFMNKLSQELIWKLWVGQIKISFLLAQVSKSFFLYNGMVSWHHIYPTSNLLRNNVLTFKSSWPRAFTRIAQYWFIRQMLSVNLQHLT